MNESFVYIFKVWPTQLAPLRFYQSKPDLCNITCLHASVLCGTNASLQ